MAYMKVLVAVTGDESDATAIDTAVKIAQPFGGVLRGLYAQGEPTSVAQFRYPSLGDSFFVQIEDAVSAAQELNEKSARSLFEDLAKSAWRDLDGSAADAAAIEWCAVDADLPDAIVFQGGIYDLLVLGEASRRDPDVTEAALFRTGRPVLLCPAMRPSHVGRNVLIAWNRSAEAGRSVVNAIPLLQQAEKVTICTIRTLAKRGPSAEECADYLSDHKIRTELSIVEPHDRDIGEILLEEAQRVKADVIVSGANYQSRMQEFLPGGVTGYLLRNATIAVMMSH